MSDLSSAADLGGNNLNDLFFGTEDGPSQGQNLALTVLRVRICSISTWCTTSLPLSVLSRATRLSPFLLRFRFRCRVRREQKQRPESGLYCLMCAEFARQRQFYSRRWAELSSDSLVRFSIQLSSELGTKKSVKASCWPRFELFSVRKS